MRGADNMWQLTEHIIRGCTTVEALDYISENYAQDLSTERLAQRYGYSLAHFCRKFKET